MQRKIYDHPVTPQSGLDATLKKCFLTHLGIYNYALDLLKENPYQDFVNFREDILRHVEASHIQILNAQALQNEMYYLHKKFKRGGCTQKLISSIQYLTLLVKGYRNGLIELDDSRTQMRFVGHDGYLTLETPLPALDYEDQLLYMNLSYSSMENQFMLSIFESTNAPHLVP